MCTKCSASPSSAISRRDFIKLSGAGIAGVFVLGVMGSSRVLAETSPEISTAVGSASGEHGVPEDLLLAMGYVNTRWETPPPEAGVYDPGDIHGAGGFGPMHLSENPQNDTLGRAAELTGISPDDLKAERAANVMGAAAVLNALAGDTRPQDLGGWYAAVKGFGGDDDLYAQEVYQVLKEGAKTQTPTGQSVELAPHPDVETPQLYMAQAAGDYSGSTWYGAYSGNYTSANRPSSNPINKVIIHVVQGSWSSAINWFQDSRAGVSAHYTVRSSDGFIGQSVREKDIGYHAGYWSYNQTSIGIEHEGYVSNPGWFTDAMYRSSARLTAYLCKKYRIPIDRSHIIGHHEVPGCSGPGGGSGCHTDPGGYWNWDKYMSLVKSYAGGTQTSGPSYVQIVDNATSGRFSASRRWISSDYHYRTDYGANYRVLRTPLSISDDAKFKIKTPRRARYAIYARWPADQGYNARTRFMIRTETGWVSRLVNQRINNGKWVYLGSHMMSAGDSYRIKVSSRSSSKGYIIADAVKVVRR